MGSIYNQTILDIAQRIYRMWAIMILGLLKTTYETSVVLAGLRSPQQEALLKLV